MKGPGTAGIPSIVLAHSASGEHEWELRSTDGFHTLRVTSIVEGLARVVLSVDYGSLDLLGHQLALAHVALDADAELEFARRARFEADRLWEQRGEAGPTWSVDLGRGGARLTVTVGADGSAVGGPQIILGRGQVACAVEVGAGGGELDPDAPEGAWAHGAWARDVYAIDPTTLDLLADAVLGPREPRSGA